MTVEGGPNILNDGLVLAFDAANVRSFRGLPQLNYLKEITYNMSNQNGTFFKVANGTETVLVPKLGLRTVKYVDIYNDYNGGSGACCPALFYFGDSISPTFMVSPSTTYTYSIVYKTDTGYTHPNYMYRYEYNASGTYRGEAGVHSTSNRTDLGDGWYHAWGQFTTNTDTVKLVCYLFHYEYATYNRVRVAAVQITQGTYIGAPQHMLEPNTVRDANVAGGGGLVNLITNTTGGELVNGVSYSDINSGVMIFDGSNDYVSNIPNTGITHGTSNFSYFAWVNLQGKPSLGTIYENGSWTSCLLIRYETDGITIYSMGSYWGKFSFNPTLNTWNHLGFVRNGNVIEFYLNGAYQTNISFTANISPSSNIFIGTSQHATNQVFNGYIAAGQIYTRALSASEVFQNFEAQRSRFGI